jgi:hypothetical protein
MPHAPAAPTSATPPTEAVNSNTPAAALPSAWLEKDQRPKIIPAKPKKSDAVLAFGIPIVIIALLGLLAMTGSSEKATSSTAAATASSPSPAAPTDAERRSKLAAVMRDEARSPEERLIASRQLVSSHAGSAEAKEASGLAPMLEELQRKANVGKQWSYDASTDDMSSRLSKSATVHSSNTFEFDFPYQGKQHARLTIRRHPRWGNNVIFRIERGQILCSSYSSCRIRVRFDDGGPRTLTGNEPADNSTETVFLSGYADLVSRIRKAKIMRVEVDVYHQGPLVAEFNVEGFDPSKLQ